MVRILHTYCNQITAAQRLEKIIKQAEEGDRPPRTAPLPRPNKQFRHDDVGAILTAWHDGNNIAAISRTLGFDYGTVRKYLLAAGIDTRSNPAPDERDRTILELHAQGKTNREIASVVGCSHSTAWLVIKKSQAATS
ncbi:helix-turn-helix domain-containing protein [Mycobacterium sp. 236(2023)]|uniref:helix-turn-helix domain-containing protein n=1 Tax=Mycobacterium sp. 236(2023) TaxID=3038163 RepID=UPI0024159476|nr:helix-turn-helix domain-containing protein [Mycobacterium sp. 236(2023)]MDG4668614.1 helix-turn-helix domain-containing protein [Mycobacterium sp. 236(2023)]